MLLPVRVSPRHRVWAEVMFRYEKYISASSVGDLSRYLLKYGRVTGVYSDEEVAHDLSRTVAAMRRDGIPHRQIVEEVSALYGVPAECVEEIIGGIPA